MQSFIAVWDKFQSMPFSALLVFVLWLSTISLWLPKRLWIFVPLLGVLFTLGYYVNVFEKEAFIPIAIAAACFLGLLSPIRGIVRLLVVLVTSAVCIGLGMHLFPGFHNWLFWKDIKLSASSASFSWYFNFDKPFMGLFALAFYIPLIREKQEIRYAFMKLLTAVTLGVTALIILALKLDIIAFQPKIPGILPLWALNNLFLTVIPEEAFFRGFLQQEMKRVFSAKWGAILSVVTISILFTLAHIPYIKDMNYLISAFAASIIYGSVYEWTGKFESAVLCHFFVNLVHMLLFTYPILA